MKLSQGGFEPFRYMVRFIINDSGWNGMSRIKNFWTLVLFAAIVSVMTTSLLYNGSVSAATAQQKFRAKLDSNNEVPAVNGTAEGVATFKANDTIITYKLNITGIHDPTGAHIHLGDKTQNGEVVVDLLKEDSSKHKDTDSGSLIRGNITAASLEGSMKGKSLSDLISTMSSGGTYINIDTEKNPKGEIRGQIKVPTSASNQTQVGVSNSTELSQ